MQDSKQSQSQSEECNVMHPPGDTSCTKHHPWDDADEGSAGQTMTANEDQSNADITDPGMRPAGNAGREGRESPRPSAGKGMGGGNSQQQQRK